MQKVSILALAAVVLMGCGSGNAETETSSKDAAVTQNQAATPVETQAETPGAVEMAPVVEETPAEPVPSPRSDYAEAEARSVAAAAAASGSTKPAVDTSQLKLAPEWALYDLEGKVVRSSDLMGKVVLVDFWATWCGPCKRSIPHLIKLHEEYEEQGVVVLGVSLDRADPQKVVKPFVAQNRINYQVLMGNMKIQQDFGGVRGIPTAFIITQDGKIYRKLVGLRPKEHYEEPIKALLGVS